MRVLHSKDNWSLAKIVFSGVGSCGLMPCTQYQTDIDIFTLLAAVVPIEMLAFLRVK